MNIPQMVGSFRRRYLRPVSMAAGTWWWGVLNSWEG